VSILQFRELGQNTKRLMKRVEANVLVPFVHWPIIITAELTGKGTGTLR